MNRQQLRDLDRYLTTPPEEEDEDEKYQQALVEELQAQLSSTSLHSHARAQWSDFSKKALVALDACVHVGWNGQWCLVEIDTSGISLPVARLRAIATAIDDAAQIKDALEVGERRIER